ncbi:hypothetical protein E2C01_082832 [Portunus trituberculatus]|uniref:Uncharacterized protein n=1 Tax=Portunus trituberculatus TaxID=210409 RepID=A0A5B7J2X7_PORTR|nr:hypothetical protein [Portunus trituberculatus]
MVSRSSCSSIPPTGPGCEGLRWSTAPSVDGPSAIPSDLASLATLPPCAATPPLRPPTQCDAWTPPPPLLPPHERRQQQQRRADRVTPASKVQRSHLRVAGNPQFRFMCYFMCQPRKVTRLRASTRGPPDRPSCTTLVPLTLVSRPAWLDPQPRSPAVTARHSIRRNSPQHSSPHSRARRGQTMPAEAGTHASAVRHEARHRGNM